MTALAAAAFLWLPVQELPDRTVVRERLERILSSADYDSGDGSPRASVLEWILRKLSGLFGRLSNLGELSPLLFWSVLGVCLALLLLIFLHGAVVVGRALRASRADRPDRDDAPRPAGVDDPRELLQRARRAADAGRRDDALRLIHRAALLGLDRRGVLRFQDSLTNGDYRRQLRARPREGEAFDALVRIHEPACFGKRPVADGDVESGFRLAALLLEGRTA